ncbi:MAG: helix-turn-helix domain-containing protein [Polyangiaceae bacterium]|nr:helix-turn-helix domain-containing protein [Polyangiaceae bacterium]
METARQLAARPAARLVRGGQETLLPLAEVEALFAGPSLIVDGCRRALRSGTHNVKLAKRPVLFALLESLARHPAGAEREVLIHAAFGAKRVNDTHRARLRVEIGRLRKLLRPVCDLEATQVGFRLLPRAGEDIAVLLPPLPGGAGALQALLADGQPWSTSALGLALGESQRNVQRALADLEANEQVRSVGRGRAQRWVSAPLSGFTTTLLLPLNVADG